MACFNILSILCSVLSALAWLYKPWFPVHPATLHTLTKHFLYKPSIQTMSINSALHWTAPHGVLKINVHGHTNPTTLSNGNSSGIGAIYRDSASDMHLLTTGVISGLSMLGNQFWAMYAPLRRAVVHEFDDVRLEIDNFHAYKLINTSRKVCWSRCLP